MTEALRPTSLDHVALWIAERDPIAALLCDHLGMHVIDRTEKFTLVGADARRGKLTLFDAEGPRDPGALAGVVLQVRDLEAALAGLPAGLEVRRDDTGVARFTAPEGLELGLVQRDDADLDYDLDHVVLRVSDVEASARALADLGFAREGDRLVVAGKWVELRGGGTEEGDRPLLNHLAVLVDSADAVERAARERGADVADVVDAANTRAVFLWTTDRIKVEFVEHKPSFSLV
jgi:catechol 2,3-dioxygenase-like lactoylglutathione lyase family enzyme